MAENIEGENIKKEIGEGLELTTYDALFKKYTLRAILIAVIVFCVFFLIIILSKLNESKKTFFPSSVRKRIKNSVENMVSTVQNVEKQEQPISQTQYEELNKIDAVLDKLVQIVGGDSLS